MLPSLALRLLSNLGQPMKNTSPAIEKIRRIELRATD